MAINLVAELGVFTNRIKIARFGILSPVMADCRNAECCTIRTCPYHIRLAEPIQDILCGDCQDVGIKVDVFKLLIPFDRKDFMPSGLKRFADASRSGEQFKHFHSFTSLCMIRVVLSLNRWTSTISSGISLQTSQFSAFNPLD